MALGLMAPQPPAPVDGVLPDGWRPDGRPSLWFVVPAHRRLRLSRACFAALRATCGRLDELGINASAVVVAEDDNLQAAREQGLGTVWSPNGQLGRRWNDGYQFAGQTGVDYVIPFGSDDIIDPDVVASSLPGPGEISCFRRSAVVSADGKKLALINVTYLGGDGVKIIPTQLLERFGFRPVEDRRKKAIDGSMIDRFSRGGLRPRYVYHDVHPLQIVDFKSRDDQLTPFEALVSDPDGRVLADVVDDPFGRLRDVYPDEVLAPIAALYTRGRRRVAA